MQQAMHLAALPASRYIPRLNAVRDRMRAAGNAPTKILIALARQLLTMINAMLRKGGAFHSA